VTRAELQSEFRRIQDRLRKTVIIVTHDMAEALSLADHVVVMEDGALVAYDRPGAIVHCVDPRVRRLLDAVRVHPRAES
jgi:osmoprotectant transport system ATP-binding protein